MRASRKPRNSYGFEDDAQKPYVFIWVLKMMLKTMCCYMGFEDDAQKQRVYIVFEMNSSDLLFLISK